MNEQLKMSLLGFLGAIAGDGTEGDLDMVAIRKEADELRLEVDELETKED